MTVRAEILRKILPVPEALIIEADEYIFTLAATLSVVSILGEALTYYRIHGGNLFQLKGFRKESILRKQQSMESLARAIEERLSELGLPKDAIHAVVETVQVEADLMRLQLSGGFPWETVGAEWKFYRIVHEDASMSHRIFKLTSLMLALFCPPRLFYNVRRNLAANGLYLEARKVFFPVPQSRHTTRSRRYGQ
jgi:hypothetical protein